MNCIRGDLGGVIGVKPFGGLLEGIKNRINEGKQAMKDQVVLAVLRHASTALGAYLAASGYTGGASQEQIAGALFILFGAGWSAIEARRNRNKIVSLKQEVAVKDVIIEQQNSSGQK